MKELALLDRFTYEHILSKIPSPGYSIKFAGYSGELIVYLLAVISNNRNDSSCI